MLCRDEPTCQSLPLPTEGHVLGFHIVRGIPHQIDCHLWSQVRQDIDDTTACKTTPTAELKQQRLQIPGPGSARLASCWPKARPKYMQLWNTLAVRRFEAAQLLWSQRFETATQFAFLEMWLDTTFALLAIWRHPPLLQIFSVRAAAADTGGQKHYMWAHMFARVQGVQLPRTGSAADALHKVSIGWIQHTASLPCSRRCSCCTGVAMQQECYQAAPLPDDRPGVEQAPSLAETPCSCAVLKGPRSHSAASTCYCSPVVLDRPRLALPCSPHMRQGCTATDTLAEPSTPASSTGLRNGSIALKASNTGALLHCPKIP